ncbi:YpiB family protein [Staphylococcus pasteuri]|uniref:YpiB family protein n=1 Tax=Staphylococcus pasteuri TaxID=45972 RepID=UPI00227874C5|nr:YpiB family protein [Staphylococcus pasteuri]WAE40724.1 YpiB family protein [Staphylococcus pasteuri]
MNSSLTKMKQSFIEYLLFHYEFKSSISVWVLNYLKASPKKLQRIHFVEEKIQQHMTLQIAEVNSDASAIQFNDHQQALVNTNEIFEVIANNDMTFDIQLHFSSEHQRESRLDDLILAQLINSPHYTSYVQDLYSISMSDRKQTTLIETLQDNIDLSLQMKEQERFYQLTQILNILKAKKTKHDIGDNNNDY